MTDAPLLAAYALSFKYSPQQQALNEMSFELNRGEFITLIGPNGSGKSTLLKLLSGIVPLQSVDQGQIKYLGTHLFDFSAAELAQRITYVGSDLKAEFPMTAEQVVGLGRVCHLDQKADRIHWAMELAQCWGLRSRDMHTLSGGERQLVALARALAQESKILLLDEALSKMDLHHQSKIGKLLKKLSQDGYTIVLVAHDLNLAIRWAERVILLNHGKILADGKVDQVIKIENLKQLYPGVELAIENSTKQGQGPRVLF